jgi:hypothetical protein
VLVQLVADVKGNVPCSTVALDTALWRQVQAAFTAKQQATQGVHTAFRDFYSGVVGQDLDRLRQADGDFTEAKMDLLLDCVEAGMHTSACGFNHIEQVLALEGFAVHRTESAILPSGKSKKKKKKSPESSSAVQANSKKRRTATTTIQEEVKEEVTPAKKAKKKKSKKKKSKK